MKTVLQGARIVDPAHKRDGEYDLLIENGMIQAIEKPGAFDDVSDAEKISLKGKVITPGLIDVHVHLREPGFEYKETIQTGLQAAVAGGFTSVACMANTQPVHDQALVTRAILEKACAANSARVFPIGAVTKGMRGEQLSDIGMMVEAGVVALSDDGLPVMNSMVMRRAMEYAKTFNVPVISHAEDLNLSAGAPMNEGAVSSLLGLSGNPSASEEIMVAREIALARLTGARVHIAHISTREGVEQVRRAKEAGVNITAEVTPHHLALNDHFILEGKHTCAHQHARTDYKMAPPLRTALDQGALLKALNDGIIDLVASDHAPHGCVDKEVEFEMAANGILGLQTTVPILLELVDQKKLSFSRMIESLTIAPAKLIGIYEKQNLGQIKVGAPADLTVMDLNITWTLLPESIVSLSSNSPFLGRLFKGQVTHTFVNGELKYAAH